MPVAAPRALKQCVQSSHVARIQNCRTKHAKNTNVNTNMYPNLEPKRVPNQMT